MYVYIYIYMYIPSCTPIAGCPPASGPPTGCPLPVDYSPASRRPPQQGIARGRLAMSGRCMPLTPAQQLAAIRRLAATNLYIYVLTRSEASLLFCRNPIDISRNSLVARFDPEQGHAGAAFTHSHMQARRAKLSVLMMFSIHVIFVLTCAIIVCATLRTSHLVQL